MVTSIEGLQRGPQIKTPKGSIDPDISENLKTLRDGASKFVDEVLEELESGFYDELDELTAMK